MSVSEAQTPSAALSHQEREAAHALLELLVRLARGEEPIPDAERTDRLADWSPLVSRLHGEVVRAALQQVILGAQVQPALQWMHEVGLLRLLLPELEATVDFTQEMGRRHKDVWKHTKQVVDQAVADPVVRWAALLHDVAKVPTRAFGPGGKVTFHGHAELGARMFDRIARRLSFPKKLRSQVRFLILHHLRANQYDGTWTDSAVRRFDREMGEHLPRLLDLSRADITSARPHKRQSALDQIAELWQRVEALREEDARVPPLPSGLGNAIMERFALEPGPIIGKLRRALEAAVEAGELQPQQESDYYLAYLEERGLLP